MANSYFMTPEERMKRKQRNKLFLYAFFILATAVLSVAVTFLVSQV